MIDHGIFAETRMTLCLHMLRWKRFDVGRNTIILNRDISRNNFAEGPSENDNCAAECLWLPQLLNFNVFISFVISRFVVGFLP